VEATPKELRIFITDEGREPFSEWFGSLRDIKARAKVRVRLDRMSLGNFGDCHGIGEGVQELRIDIGPGIASTLDKKEPQLYCYSVAATKARRTKTSKSQSDIGTNTGGGHEKK
jgi:putative addiction module killer protein